MVYVAGRALPHIYRLSCNPTMLEKISIMFLKAGLKFLTLICTKTLF